VVETAVDEAAVEEAAVEEAAFSKVSYSNRWPGGYSYFSSTRGRRVGRRRQRKH
jgi:hypothetical protein